MALILVYAEASRSQLYPLVPVLQKLSEAGHKVVVKAGRYCVGVLREAGLEASPLSDYVEFFRLDDWQGENYEQSLRMLLRYLVQRSRYDFNDFAAALRYDSPDLVIVNATCLGACAGAIASGVPTVTWSTELLPFPSSGIPPFGPGLPYTQSKFMALANWARSSSVQKCFEADVDDFNCFLLKLGIHPLRDMQGWFTTIPNLLYFTSEPFEYPRQWPSNVSLVGPCNWEPPAPQNDLGTQLDSHYPPILVSLGCSYQNNGDLLRSVIEAMRSDKYEIVATTCGISTQEFKEEQGATLTRFASHNQLLKHAVCAVSCGGLCFVQKALCHGVPVCVVPQVRSQYEVAQRVVNANVGTMVDMRKLSVSAIGSAIRKAIGKKKQATELAEKFDSEGTADRCFHLIEHILAEHEK